MNPILVTIFLAIIFPSPKLPKAQNEPVIENTHPLTLLRDFGHQKSESGNRQLREAIKMHSMKFCFFICNSLRANMRKKQSKTMNDEYTWRVEDNCSLFGTLLWPAIYFAVFCTGCVVRSVPPTQEYSSQRAIFSSSVPGHSSLPKYWRVASSWHASKPWQVFFTNSSCSLLLSSRMLQLYRTFSEKR